MLKKHSSMNTNSTTMKLITVKGNEKIQSKNLGKVEASSRIYNDVDASSTVSTRINARAIRPVGISKHFAALTSVTSPLENEQSKVELVEEPLKNISLTENVSLKTKTKQNHKHKHHHHNGKHRHHHHQHHCHHRHHCHHHRNHRCRVKNAGQQQQPTIIYRKVSNNEDNTVDKNALANVSYGTALIDDQQAPLVVHRNANVQQSSVANGISQPVCLNEDQNIKLSKRNIPLRSIENKIVSQRPASVDETQVGNFPIFCTQSAPSLINPYGAQQIEQIYYEDDCCVPSLTTNCCLPSSTTNCCLPSSTTNCCLPSSTINYASNSYVLQQPDPCVCLPQQQSQLYLCTDTNTGQDYICSSNCNSIQQTSVPQQIIYVDSTPSTQPLLCVPQTPIQPTPSIIIQQQPQIQAQPLQIIQAPQTQPAQYLRVSSATPQLIQAVPVPNVQPPMQPVQVATQAMAASPQILYQRPYDPVIIPNQQLAIAQSPGLPLSQPSYARPGPRMFQHALVRTIANRTGLPIPLSASGGLPLVQQGMIGSYGAAPLASPANALFTGGLPPSAHIPIVPLTAGGLLIPFQPSEPEKGMTRGSLSRIGGYPSVKKNFDKTRQQIEQRAQLLADLQRQNLNRLPSSPVRSANTGLPPLPAFSRSGPLSPPGLSSNIPRAPFGLSSSVPISSPGLSSNIPRTPFGLSPTVPISSPGFSSNVPITPSGLSSNLPQLPPPPPPVITSQTPYKIRDVFDTSSSSSSKSSASSILPASSAQPNPSGLMYSQPSFADSQRGSILSGPSAPYQSVRP